MTVKDSKGGEIQLSSATVRWAFSALLVLAAHLVITVAFLVRMDSRLNTLVERSKEDRMSMKEVQEKIAKYESRLYWVEARITKEH